MDPTLYMSEGVFVILMYLILAGLGGTVGLLLYILFKEMKNNSLW